MDGRSFLLCRKKGNDDVNNEDPPEESKEASDASPDAVAKETEQIGKGLYAPAEKAENCKKNDPADYNKNDGKNDAHSCLLTLCVWYLSGG